MRWNAFGFTFRNGENITCSSRCGPGILSKKALKYRSACRLRMSLSLPNSQDTTNCGTAANLLRRYDYTTTWKSTEEEGELTTKSHGSGNGIQRPSVCPSVFLQPSLESLVSGTYVMSQTYLRSCDIANVINGYQLIPQSVEQNRGIVCPENDVPTATCEHTWRLFDDHLSILNLHQKKESSNSNSNKLMHACVM